MKSYLVGLLISVLSAGCCTTSSSAKPLDPTPYTNASPMRSIEVYIDGKSHAAGLSPNGQVTLTVVNNGIATTTFFDGGAELARFSAAHEEGHLILAPQDVLQGRGFDPSSISPSQVTLDPKRSHQVGPTGLNWSCEDLLMECGNLIPKEKPEVYPAVFELIPPTPEPVPCDKARCATNHPGATCRAPHPRSKQCCMLPGATSCV